MKTSKEKKILVVKIGDEYHAKPLNPKYDMKTALVPVWLFDGYVDTRAKLRDAKEEIETYFNRPNTD